MVSTFGKGVHLIFCLDWYLYNDAECFNVYLKYFPNLISHKVTYNKLLQNWKQNKAVANDTEGFVFVSTSSIRFIFPPDVICDLS